VTSCIAKETKPLEVIVEDQISNIAFDVIQSSTNPMIMGLL